MKVCIASLFGLQRPAGGLQTHAKWLIAFFEEKKVPYIYLSPYQYHWFLVYPVFAARYLFHKPCRQLSLIWFRFWHYYFLKKVLSCRLSQEKIDILNAQGPLSALAALKVRDKQKQSFQIILTMHMNWPSEADEEAVAGNIRRGGWYYKKIKKMEEYVFLRVDKIVFVSSYIQQAMLKIYPFLRNKPNVVIYNGIKEDAAAKVADIAEDRGLRLKRLITIGELNARKNQEFLLYVLKVLETRFADIQLLLVGKGERQPYLDGLARRLGIRSKVIFTGYTQDVSSYLRTSYLYVHAALGENLPYALIEAMSYGIPIVALAVGGIPEIITYGYNGFLVEDKRVETFARYISALLVDRNMYVRMAGHSRQVFLQRFEYRMMGSNYLEFYVR
ncbi:MAG: glycosyltransferase family 4 protein [Candidatus Omnitrophica bacterium]|nr:glycosyltransferase family 4 protein [Candidatus Omnitrophota bacterium]